MTGDFKSTYNSNPPCLAGVMDLVTKMLPSDWCTGLPGSPPAPSAPGPAQSLRQPTSADLMHQGASTDTELQYTIVIFFVLEVLNAISRNDIKGYTLAFYHIFNTRVSFHRMNKT